MQKMTVLVPGRLTNYINYSVVCISSDFIISLVPLIFIRKLSRPMFEKVLLSILMALWLCVSIIAIIRLVKLTEKRMDITSSLQNLLEVSIWASLEGMIGIIAACLPCLKRPTQRLLEHIGILPVEPSSEDMFPVQNSGFIFNRPVDVVSQYQLHDEASTVEKHETGTHNGHELVSTYL